MSGRPDAASPTGDVAIGWRSLATVPNVISVLRLALVPVTLVALLNGAYAAALLAFAVAGVSDALDGYLARRLGQETAFGRLIDPAADKLLLVGTTLVLGWLGLLPVWLVALIVGRDIVIVLAVIATWAWGSPMAVAPSRISKTNTLAQLLLCGAALVHLATDIHAPLLHTLLIGSVALLTSASAILYADALRRHLVAGGAKGNR